MSHNSAANVAAVIVVYPDGDQSPPESYTSSSTSEGQKLTNHEASVVLEGENKVKLWKGIKLS